MLLPNRVVAIATAVIALILGLLPVLGDMDTTSTAGIIAGIAALLGVAYKWIDGWQKHEAREAIPRPADDLIDPIVEDEPQTETVVVPSAP